MDMTEAEFTEKRVDSIRVLLLVLHCFPFFSFSVQASEELCLQNKGNLL